MLEQAPEPLGLLGLDLENTIELVEGRVGVGRNRGEQPIVSDGGIGGGGAGGLSVGVWCELPAKTTLGLDSVTVKLARASDRGVYATPRTLTRDATRSHASRAATASRGACSPSEPHTDA